MVLNYINIIMYVCVSSKGETSKYINVCSHILYDCIDGSTKEKHASIYINLCFRILHDCVMYHPKRNIKI